ncbi:8268_t:CDS:2 [Entrophospora sp. SA101]|nr:8268_t:CDS:2 [Entrophospora sp. SA101]
MEPVVSYEEEKGWNLLQISKHVLAGFREVIDFGNDHNIIEQSYSGIIRAAWQNDPLLRPYLYLIFLKLDELSKDNPIEEGSSLSAMLRFQKYDDSDQVVEIIYDDNEVETKNEEEILPVNKDSNLDIVPVVRSVMSFDEGVKAHENGDFIRAWECFNSHHMIDNLEATYWVGHYLYEGYLGEKKIDEAISLYKLAADRGVPKAQYSYAKSLIENDIDANDDSNSLKCKEILEYLELAAHGGIPSAIYMLGDIFLNGKYNVEKDENLAVQYLKMAALKNNQDATDLLKQLKIKLF